MPLTTTLVSMTAAASLTFGVYVPESRDVSCHPEHSEGSAPVARPDIPELINVQPVQGEAKPYQIRQFLRLVEKYNLRLENRS